MHQKELLLPLGIATKRNLAGWIWAWMHSRPFCWMTSFLQRYVYEIYLGNAVMLFQLGNRSQLCSLSHTFQSCSLCNVFPVQYIPPIIHSVFHLFCISFYLILYLFHVSAQIVPQLSGHWGRISTFGLCLKSCLDSSHVFQSVMRTKDFHRSQLEEQDVYRKRRHPVFCWVIKLVIYEII